MKQILIILALFLFGCTTTKYIPIQSNKIVEYRDSLVEIRDTITIQVPFEIEKNIIPYMDTSTVETSLAISIAYIDSLNNTLIHKIKNKQIPYSVPIDTFVKVEYEKVIEEEQVPFEVVKEVPYIPTVFWYLLAWTILTVIYITLKLFKK